MGGPPTDWNELVQTNDVRGVFQAAADEQFFIDIRTCPHISATSTRTLIPPHAHGDDRRGGLGIGSATPRIIAAWVRAARNQCSASATCDGTAAAR